MARLNVNPTRMELTRLKRSLVTARRGHKLLKDKRDELMRQFLLLVQDNKALRRRVEKALVRANKSFAVASATMDQNVLDEALLYPKKQLDLNMTLKNVMSVNVPVYSCEVSDTSDAEVFPYSFAQTPGELDEAIMAIAKVLPELVKLAQTEKNIQLMAGEIEKTRRRVNALEYVMIPQYEETIRFIQMKLDENERDGQTRQIKVKDMIIADALEQRRLFEEKALNEFGG
jgi:V/A-type H+-transporting ATPase subunit D